MRRWLIWTVVALSVGAAVGVVAARLRPETVAAHLDYTSSHIRGYSYNDSLCRKAVDPISVVFYRNASASNVNTHANHHNGWGSSGLSSAQYFYDHGCKRPTGDIASAGPFDPWRYHMRHFQSRDAARGTYSLATPHRETLVRCTDGSTKHAVDPTTDTDPGGFVRAKWYIADTWHYWNDAPAPHFWQGSEYWGNTAALWQCNGQAVWNDGWVDFIEIR